MSHKHPVTSNTARTQKQSYNPLHVVYIITKLELGGAQKVCLTLFDGVQSPQIITHLISGDEGILVDQVRTKEHVQLLPSLKRELSFKSIWGEITTFWHIVHHLKKLKKQHHHILVHTHSTKAGIIGRWAAFCAGIPYRIHTIHGYAFHTHQSKITWFLIYCAELITSFITTHFVCVSSADVKTGITVFPRFARKHTIIRAAVDWQQFFIPAVRTTITSGRDNQPCIFGTIACFKPQKNMLDLLQAFAWAHARNKDIRLEIIGDGIQRKMLETWIAEHQLTTVITLHGWQKKVAPIMQSWHVFVLSSLWEGLPCAIVEARLLKLPVISYQTGGIPDVIFHQHNGLLCQQGDWQQLARHMVSLVENKTLYRQLSEYVDDLHDFKDTHMISAHAALYSSLHTSLKKNVNY